MSYMKLLCVGPGGRKCPCCFPRPGTYARRAEFRSAKRKDNRNARQTISEWLAEMEADNRSENFYDPLNGYQFEFDPNDYYMDYDDWTLAKDEYDDEDDDYGDDPYYDYDYYEYE